MTSETKQQVFDELLTEAYGYSVRKMDIYRARYAAASDVALPDDLPVIPKDVSEWLTWCKSFHHSLKDALDGETRVSEDVFARAWLLGVCSIEETGEIVKLEAED